MRRPRRAASLTGASEAAQRLDMAQTIVRLLGGWGSAWPRALGVPYGLAGRTMPRFGAPGPRLATGRIRRFGLYLGQALPSHRIIQQQAAEQLDILRQLGEASEAQEDASGYTV
jgi:hypothetical protein